MVNHSDISLYLHGIYRCNRISNCVQESQSGILFIGIKPLLKIGPFIHSHSNKYKTPLFSYTKQWEISRIKLTHGIKYFWVFSWVCFPFLFFFYFFFFLVQHVFPFAEVNSVHSPFSDVLHWFLRYRSRHTDGPALSIDL